MADVHADGVVRLGVSSSALRASWKWWPLGTRLGGRETCWRGIGTGPAWGGVAGREWRSGAEEGGEQGRVGGDSSAAAGLRAAYLMNRIGR
jgi:hypothetical protein